LLIALSFSISIALTFYHPGSHLADPDHGPIPKRPSSRLEDDQRYRGSLTTIESSIISNDRRIASMEAEMSKFNSRLSAVTERKLEQNLRRKTDLSYLSLQDC